MVDYDAFSRRHIGPSEDQAKTMLMELGYSSMAVLWLVVKVTMNWPNAESLKALKQYNSSLV